MKLTEKQVLARDVLLDPNNYRFQDQPDYVRVAPDRYQEAAVQAKARQRLRGTDGLMQLKASILKNGFITVERIVVRDLSGAPGKYVVVEGNRRVAAILSILDDHEAGATVDQLILKSIQEIPVLVAEASSQNDLDVFLASLMGIRHVSGIKQWDGYQRAKLVADMRNSMHLTSADIADRLGMSTIEVNRRYKAFSALEQMQKSDDFGDYADPSMYPLFHEAVSVPQVRNWLGWDDQLSLFQHADETNAFYSLLVPVDTEDGSRPPKIESHRDVRELKSILSNVDAKAVLLDQYRTFADALATARKDEISGQWRTNVITAVEALDDLGVKEIKAFGASDRELLVKLKAVTEERLGDFDILNGASQ